MNNTLIMVPAYNEERSVGSVASSLMQLYPDFDVVVIDDGSQDRTADEAAKSGAGVVSLPFHAGGATVMLTGYLIALKGRYSSLVKIDADGQHKPQDVNRVLEPVIQDEADIGVGSRYVGRAEALGSDSATKLAGRVFSSELVSSLVKGTIVTDTTSGLRAWNRRALNILTRIYLNRKRLPDASIFWPVETIMACRERLRIREIPIEILPRLYGKSKSYPMLTMLKYPFKLLSLSTEVVRRNTES